MTRPDKKAAERAALDALLSALVVVPTKIESGETPDFILSLGEKTVGVELTTFQSNGSMDSGLGRRQVESEWESLEKAIAVFRQARPQLAKLNVGLMFKDAGPRRAEHQLFMEEIAAFVLARAESLSDQDDAFWPPSFTSPLMEKYLRTVYLRRCNYAVWHSNLVAGSIGLPDSTLTRIVQDKAGKAFRPADEFWLAIQSTARISELLLPLNGAADFEAIPGLGTELEASPFTRVFVFGPGGLFQWSQAAGWTT